MTFMRCSNVSRITKNLAGAFGLVLALAFSAAAAISPVQGRFITNKSTSVLEEFSVYKGTITRQFFSLGDMYTSTITVRMGGIKFPDNSFQKTAASTGSVPSAPDQSIQFNNLGSLGGSASLIWDRAAGALTLGGGAGDGSTWITVNAGTALNPVYVKSTGSGANGLIAEASSGEGRVIARSLGGNPVQTTLSSLSSGVSGLCQGMGAGDGCVNARRSGVPSWTKGARLFLLADVVKDGTAGPSLPPQMIIAPTGVAITAAETTIGGVVVSTPLAPLHVGHGLAVPNPTLTKVLIDYPSNAYLTIVSSTTGGGQFYAGVESTYTVVGSTSSADLKINGWGVPRVEVGQNGVNFIQWANGTVQVSSPAAGGGGTPALPFNSVQFNNAGAFGGTGNFNWSGSSLSIIGGGLNVNNDVTNQVSGVFKSSITAANTTEILGLYNTGNAGFSASDSGLTFYMRNSAAADTAMAKITSVGNSFAAGSERGDLFIHVKNAGAFPVTPQLRVGAPGGLNAVTFNAALWPASGSTIDLFDDNNFGGTSGLKFNANADDGTLLWDATNRWFVVNKMFKAPNGLITSTVTATAFNATTTSMTVTGAGGFNATFGVTAATAVFSTNVSAATPLTVTNTGSAQTAPTIQINSNAQFATPIAMNNTHASATTHDIDFQLGGSLVGRIESGLNDIFIGAGSGGLGLNVDINNSTNKVEFRNATSASNIRHLFNTSGNDGEYDWENTNNRFNFLNNVNLPNLTATSFNTTSTSATVTGNFAVTGGTTLSSMTVTSGSIDVPKLKTSNYTLTAADQVIYASSTITAISTMTLPAVVSGQRIQITKVDKSTTPVVVLAASGENIYAIGLTTITLLNYGNSISLIGDSVNKTWYDENAHGPVLAGRLDLTGLTGAVAQTTILIAPTRGWYRVNSHVEITAIGGCTTGGFATNIFWTRGDANNTTNNGTGVASCATVGAMTNFAPVIWVREGSAIAVNTVDTKTGTPTYSLHAYVEAL